MANSLLTIDMITREAARVLANSLVLSNSVNRQYDKSFAKSGAKIGTTLRVRLPDRSLVTDGAALQVQDESQQYTTINASTQKHIGLAFSQAERTMSLDDYSENIIKPRVSQLAASVDADLANIYRYFGQSVGTAGTTPATSAVLLAGQQKLNEMAAPMDGRSVIVNPAANAALVEGMKGFFNPSGTISSQFKSGNMGKGVLGFDNIAMTQSIANHTTGSRLSGAVVATTIAAQGATSLVITTSGAASQTVKLGDVFTVSGVYAVNPQTRQSTGSLYQFVVLADATAATNTLTVTVPAMYTSAHALAHIDAFPVATTGAVTWMGGASTAYPQNLIHQKDAFTLVTADLELPDGVDSASRVVHDGISIAVVKDFDVINYRTICRLDVLYGYACLRPELAVRLWG